MKKIIYKLKTEGTFDSAHHLKGYLGKCKNPHGHSFRVVVFVEGEKLDKIGMLWDFTNLKKILDKYDHKDLNDLKPFKDVNPTAENICMNILAELIYQSPTLKFKVRVFESPKSSCEVDNYESE